MTRSSLVSFGALLLSLLFLPCPAFAAEGASSEEEEKTAEGAAKTSSLASSEMTPRELRKAVSALDRADPAVDYALSLRSEGRVGLGAAVGVMGAALAVSAADLMLRTEGNSFAPYALGISLPLGLGLVALALPPVLASAKYLRWYLDRGPAPSSVARLRLINRWRGDLLRLRRDAALIGLGCMSGAAAVSAISWADRDSRGKNGGGDIPYQPMDAISTLTLVGLSAGMAVGAVVFAATLQRHRTAPHPLFVLPSLSVGPPASTTELRVPSLFLGVSGRF